MVTDHLPDHYDLMRHSRFFNNTGSTLLETTLFIHSPAIFHFTTTFLLNIFIRSYQLSYTKWSFLLEFCGVVLPLILILTIFSNHICRLYIVYFFILFPILLVFYFKKNLNKIHWRTLFGRHRFHDDKLHGISHFRGMVNLYSAICILAADFNCFPERFLKTNFYGFGLMDTGVGLFVAALGLSSVYFRPKPRPTSSTVFFTTVLRKSSPLFLIGLGRYFTISAVNYHQSVSEYGVHWNFFITLSLLIIFNEILFGITDSVKHILFLFVFLICTYEYCLSRGLKFWIMGDAPRNSFWSANREGLCSLIGYELIYLSTTIIRNVLPRKNDTYEKYLNVLFWYSWGFVVCMSLTIVSHYSVGVSRRCANCGYVFWITGMTLGILIILIVFELLVIVLNDVLKIRIRYLVPVIIEAVNFNGLAFFLLANVITGVINLSLNTLMTDQITGFAVILLYALFCCAITVIFYIKNIHIR